VPGYEASGGLGFGAPKGVSVEIVDKLNSATNAIVADPNTKKRLVDIGVEPMSMSPAAFGTFIAAETEKWAKVIKVANIKPE
jgi:tripartite-type tricarboxylate transporter receptor subunit TctC